MEKDTPIKLGTVVQLNELTKNPHFKGALMMITEPKGFGAQGFVNCLDKGNAYYRASWEEMEYVGQAPLVPRDEVETEAES